MLSGCSHRPVIAPHVAVPHVLLSVRCFPHPCLQPPALLCSFPINQSIKYGWAFFVFGRLFFFKHVCLLGSLLSFFRFLSFFVYFLIFIFFCVCFLIFCSFFVLFFFSYLFFMYFLAFPFLVPFRIFPNNFRLFDGWALFVFGRLFIYPACRFGNLFSLFSFFVVFGYHSITSVLQSTSAVSHWWSDWTHPDQPVWGCLNSVLAVLLHHLELIQLSKKTNLYMLNI